MLEYNGGDPDPSGVCRKGGKTPKYSCRSFFVMDSERYFDDWAWNNGVKEGLMPTSIRQFVAITDDGGGNQFRMAVTGKNAGKIYFWDHERDCESDFSMKAGKPVANSFEEFLNQFAADPDDEPTSETKVWEELIELRDEKGIVEWLNNGGKLDGDNESAYTTLELAVELAIEVNCLPIVNALIRHGASIQGSINIASRLHRWSILTALLRSSPIGTIEISSAMLSNALEGCSSVSVIEALLDAGAPVLGEHFGQCPLYSAALFKCNPDIIKLLLKRGAIFEQSAAKESPLAQAIYKHNLEAVKILLEAGDNLYKAPDVISSRMARFMIRLRQEEGKPNPNPVEVSNLKYMIDHERRVNAPKAPIAILEQLSDELPPNFKKAVIEHAAMVGQKP